MCYCVIPCFWGGGICQAEVWEIATAATRVSKQQRGCGWGGVGEVVTVQLSDVPYFSLVCHHTSWWSFWDGEYLRSKPSRNEFISWANVRENGRLKNSKLNGFYGVYHKHK